MKYSTAALLISLIFLSYMNYKNSKKIQQLTVAVNEIKQVLTPEEEPLISIGTVVPDFELLNTKEEMVTMDSFADSKRKVLVFSSKNCPYCDDYYPELAKFSEKHAEIPLIVFQMDASVEENKDFLEKNKYSFEMLQSTEEVLDKFMISGTPTTVVIDEDNRVINVGYFSKIEELEEVL